MPNETSIARAGSEAKNGGGVEAGVLRPDGPRPHEQDRAAIPLKTAKDAHGSSTS